MSHTRARSKEADEATRLVVRPSKKGRGVVYQEERVESIYRILHVRFLIFLPGRGPPPEGSGLALLLRLLRPMRPVVC